MRPIKNRKPTADDIKVANSKLSSGKKFPLLLSSAIYGANASGKTNFTAALRAMDRIVLAKNDDTILQDTITPFRLSKKTLNKPTTFEITIIADDNVLYEFGFSATQDKIHKEWLYGYPKGRMKTYYKRELKKGKEDEYKYTNRLSGKKKLWEEATIPGRLFLSTAIQLHCKELRPAYDWFAKKLNYIGDELPISFSAHYYAEERKDKDNVTNDDIIDFVKIADYAIKNIVIKEADVSKEVLGVLKNIAGVHGKPDDMETLGKHQDIFLQRETLEGDIVKFDLRNEARGIRKIFGLSVPILLALKRNEVLILDEFHNSLHPLLSRYIIRLFHRKNSQAQLIFTTHDSSLLDDADNVLSREQIWFCDKDYEGASELYSLVEFKIRREIKNFERAYLAGRYGGIPILLN